MPESTFDRIVLVLGLCALAGLVALIVPEWREYTSADDPARPAEAPGAVAAARAEVMRPAPAPVVPPPAPLRTEVPAGAGLLPPSSSLLPGGESAATATQGAPARKARVATLRLVAASGDCWVEARSGSVSGRQLYYGLLQEGSELMLSGRVVWLRLGAPQNLAGWIGTKPVRNLPSAAATVLATPAGVRTLALG